MPYFITNSHEDCTSWAVVKQDGELVACHDTEESATDQMVAISLEEGLEPGGTYSRQKRAAPDELEVGDFVRWESGGGTAQGRITRIVRDGEINVPDSSFTITGTPEDPAALIRIYREGEEGWEAQEQQVGHKFSTLRKIDDLRSEQRELPDAYRPANAEDVPDGRACGNCMFYREDQQNEEGLSYCERWDDYVRGDYYCDAWEPVEGERSFATRQVNLDPPAYMRAAARQGLKYYEEGLAGDGLVERTVREARAMANGNVTADKWVRLRAWIARHLGDLDSPSANPDNEDYPSAGVVAHLLWGSGPSKRAAQRALKYAEGVVTRLEEENSKVVSVESRNMAKIETRVNVSEFEVREYEDGMRFTGYAAVFNSASQPLPFVERIAPGAFKRSLDSRNDIKLLWNHDTGSVLGSTRAGTLTLEEDYRGLKVDAMLPNTSLGRDVRELIKRGDVDSMSFGFSVPEGGDDWSANGMERTLNSVRLHEVSIVAFPAYPGTAGSTAVRGLTELAQRASVDADELADAILALEEGKNLTLEQNSLLSQVISAATPDSEVATETETETVTDNSLDMLELYKKKLAYMNKDK